MCLYATVLTLSLCLSTSVIAFPSTLRRKTVRQARENKSLVSSIHLALIDNSIDISPSRNGSLLKEVVRRGDSSHGYPLVRDTVEIEWKMHDLEGNLIHDSYAQRMEQGDEDDDIFNFRVGAEPREVILGFEYAVRSMLVGEVSVFTIAADLAFGRKGAEGLVAPNTDLRCELELVNLFPSASRKYQTVGQDESIREELMDKLETGESPIAPVVTHKNAPRDNQLQSPVPPGTGTTSESIGTDTDTAIPSAGPTGAEPRFFDESKHKVDPRLQVLGDSEPLNIAWEETSTSLEVQVFLQTKQQRQMHSRIQSNAPPASKESLGPRKEDHLEYKKSDVTVQIDPNYVKVVVRSDLCRPNEDLPNAETEPIAGHPGTIIFEGPLEGKTNPSESSWAIVNDPRSLRGSYIQLSLEKNYASRDIWATVLSRMYLESQLTPADDEGEESATGGGGGGGTNNISDADDAEYTAANYFQ